LPTMGTRSISITTTKNILFQPIVNKDEQQEAADADAADQNSSPSVSARSSGLSGRGPTNNLHLIPGTDA
jgi:hypothetical protein